MALELSPSSYGNYVGRFSRVHVHNRNYETRNITGDNFEKEMDTSIHHDIPGTGSKSPTPKRTYSDTRRFLHLEEMVIVVLYGGDQTTESKL
jgi:hypothetical protein